MMNPGWKEEKWYPGKKKRYVEIEKPAMKTWIAKTQVVTIPTQTRGKKTIHSKQCTEMVHPGQKLEEQWKKRHNEIQKQKRK